MGLVLSGEGGGEVRFDDFEESTGYVAAVWDWGDVSMGVKCGCVCGFCLIVPLPMLQSSWSVDEYVFVESFCTAVASAQPGILND